MNAETAQVCECDFDRDFHRALNARRGDSGDRCRNDAADHMNGWPGGVISSPALCMGCLFGCAE